MSLSVGISFESTSKEHPVIHRVHGVKDPKQKVNHGGGGKQGLEGSCHCTSLKQNKKNEPINTGYEFPA